MHHLMAALLPIFFFQIVPAQAHHVSSAASSGNRTALSPGLRTKPVTQAYASYDFVQLDGNVGQVHGFTIGGEYSFSERFSAGLNVPVVLIDHNFRAQASGLGDVSIAGKVLLWESRRTFAFASTALSLPAGNDNEALGRGSVGQESGVHFGINIGRWSLQGATGVNCGYESASEPTLVSSMGVTAPYFFGGRAKLSLGISNQIFLSSDVLKDGSMKVFLQPGFAVTLDKRKRVETYLSGRIGIADTLSRKAGVAIVNTSFTLLNDVTYGVSMGMSFAFR